ncbi:MAG TPA: VWA domain-containing protein [Firmicutes bacterium]|nr:VWA domain-containing protein [Bacillota bacterium]
MIRSKEDWRPLGLLLAQALQGPAVRLGESTVISRSVHVIEVERPQEVKVVLAADAGQVFYGRGRPGTVYHVDTFHALGRVNHRAIAAAVKAAVVSSAGVEAAVRLLDHMDLQTGTGGGRLSGSLAYGRKAAVRRAHANHVHIAAQLEGEAFPVLVPVVAAVEQAILEQGLEIRKIERIVVDATPQGAGPKADLSPYASTTDSLLKENREPRGDGTTPQQGRQRQGLEGVEEALGLSRETLPPQELLRLLKSLPWGPGAAAQHARRWGDLEHTLAALEGRRLVRRERGRLVLTAEGRRLADFLEGHLPELESYFRQLLRRVIREDKGRTPAGGREPVGNARPQRPVALAPEPGGARELDLPATVLAAARRWLQGRERPRAFTSSDLVYTAPKRRRQRRIVLVLDSSASMAGDRLRAARFLAEHLVLATRDKVAVIPFQEQDILVPGGFTGHLETIERQLLALKAYGLTPLAKALRETIAFVRGNRVRRPFIVLITDGIPTVPLAAGDPAQDALEVAREMARLRLELTCIGLDPNRRFLEELCHRAGGRLHIIEEMEPGTLARLVHKELVQQR